MDRKGSIKHLNKAKTAKNDEFYTILSDIENELRHYKRHFKGKVVLSSFLRKERFQTNVLKLFISCKVY